MNSKQRRKSQRKTPTPEFVDRAVSVSAQREEGSTAFKVTVSTDTPLDGPFGRLSLSHKSDAIVTDRIAHKGLPVVAGTHSNEILPVGRVHNLNAGSGSTLDGDMVLSSNREDLARDIDDGIVTDGSIRARLISKPRAVGDHFVVDRWEPIHFALVATGVDQSVNISRSEDENMSGDNETGTTVDRAEEIGALFAGLDGPEFLKMENEALKGSQSVEEVSRSLTAKLKERANSVEVPNNARISETRNELGSWLDLAEAQLQWRAGLVAQDKARDVERELTAAGMADMSLMELAREYTKLRNISMSGNQGAWIARSLQTPAAIVDRAAFSHSTSDFANALGSVADKSLARGYTENQETYRAWTRNETITHFRSQTFISLSGFSDMALVADGAQFTHGSMSEKTESMQLNTYGRMFSIGRQAIQNDDVGMLSRVPQAMGRTAARLVGDLVYGVLTDTTTTLNETGRVLFNATDGNLTTGPGTAISTDSIDVGRVAMRTQTAPAPRTGETGVTLNTPPAFIIVPAALETTAAVQINSELQPEEGATTSFRATNPFFRAMTVVAEARLDADSATAWYLAAGQNADVETISVGWLNGVQRPRLDQQQGFDAEGVQFKVAIDCDAAALDFRGLYKNDGA